MSTKRKILIVILVLVLSTLACKIDFDPFASDEYPVGETFQECIEWYMNYRGMNWDEAYKACMPNSP